MKPLFTAFLFLSLPLSGATVILSPSADATLYGPPSEAMADGAGDWFFAGVNADGNTRRALIEFDVSLIPAGSVISAVDLRLVVDRGRLFPSPLTAQRVTESWNEGITNASGREGQGSPAQGGDVTWAFRELGGSAWSTPGGDFAAAESASAQVSGAGVVTLSGPGLVSDVQLWLADPSHNHGWIIRGVEYLTQTANRIISRTNPISGSRPQLTVTYSPVPEPGILLLLLTVAGCSAFRRHRFA